MEREVDGKGEQETEIWDLLSNYLIVSHQKAPNGVKISGEHPQQRTKSFLADF